MWSFIILTPIAKRKGFVKFPSLKLLVSTVLCVKGVAKLSGLILVSSALALDLLKFLIPFCILVSYCDLKSSFELKFV